MGLTGRLRRETSTGQVSSKGTNGTFFKAKGIGNALASEMRHSLLK